MSQMKNQDGRNRTRYTKNLALAAVAGQVGCVTIIIVVVALLAGLWLDNRFGTSPILLAFFLIASVPVTVVVMLWIVRSVTARIEPSSESVVEKPEESTNRGTDASPT
jgi:F0F1-type ATP synthase assembly protein I